MMFNFVDIFKIRFETKNLIKNIYIIILII